MHDLEPSTGQLVWKTVFLAAVGLIMFAVAMTAVRAESSNPVAGGDILAANLDRSVDPGQDFFDYANGGWLSRNPIPAAESGWGIGNLVDEELYVKLRTINEQAAQAHLPAGSDQQKVGDFWTTAMDEAKANRLGITPLKAELALIDAIQSVPEALDVAFTLRPVGMEAFCDVSVSQDEKQSDVMSVHLTQGGLGLPDRDFYFNTDKGIAHIRQEYVGHLARLLGLLGRPPVDAQKAAKEVMKFETSLAKASRKLEDLRDPEKNYHKMSPASLTATQTPLINWDQRLAGMSLLPDQVIVGQPEFFTAMNRLLAKTPVPVLKDYLRLDAQGEAMGMVLGKVFVQEYFPPQTKQRYTTLVEAIRTAYRERIDRLDWMSEATKAKARDKLAKVTAKVGYPDHWKDYSALVVGTNSYCENMLNSARWEFHDMISKYGKPVDRTEWEMTPQTYNAYYEPANNEIVLPAAMFTVPGKRDAELDDALVYGYAAASTIGHEITHGFDDEGRQFDPAGNLKDWWTSQDAARFQKRTEVLVAQFNACEPLPGLHINGRASLGENLADYGGVLLGLDAFKKTEQYKKGEKIGGFTPIQRFFLGYAYSWMYQERVESLRNHLLSDVHSPAKWRVNGPLSNVPEFHEAFGVKPGQPMFRPPADVVKVW